MPLKVTCPNGCVVRMPNNRAGKLIRCPGCKSVLQIPVVSAGLNTDDSQPVLLQAMLSKKTEQNFIGQSNSSERVNLTEQELFGAADVDVDSGGMGPSVEDFPVLIETANNSKPQHQSKQDVIAARVQRAKNDRIVLSRFFAICLCLVAIVNMVPAIYYWHGWSVNAEIQPLPRWTYLQIFVAALHFVYAVYLVQVSDWAALKTVCIAMGIVGAIFAAVAVGLALGMSQGGTQGNVARFLNLPYSLVRSAGVWCVAMLCLATLISYLTGREAANWQRIEQLVKRVLIKTS